MRESKIEAAFCKKVIGNGGIAYKFVSPGRRNVPDRIVLYPVKEEHKMIVANYIQFVELKATDKKPRPAQLREIKRLRKLGFYVGVINN